MSDERKGLSLKDVTSPGNYAKIEELQDQDAALTYSDSSADLVFEIERRWQQAVRLWAWGVKHSNGPVNQELRALLNRLAARYSLYLSKGKYQLFMQTSAELDPFIKSASDDGFPG